VADSVVVKPDTRILIWDGIVPSQMGCQAAPNGGHLEKSIPQTDALCDKPAKRSDAGSYEIA
jgi:hypothetical protein